MSDSNPSAPLPADAFPPDHTTYQLRIWIQRKLHLGIGALGQQTFPAGEYIYTGSARRNLAARIRRHLSSEKRLRWHIDYLLANTAVRITAVTTSAREECEWNQSVTGVVMVSGFGASDCRSGCGAHLLYLGNR
jgi:Uri superfamily endonuclease